MARLILLDSGPLGLIVRAPAKPEVVRCLTWLNAISTNGATIVIPEIVHYEVRRELIRIRAVGILRRLQYYLDPTGGLIHLPISTNAIIKAAEFWAYLRQSGIPTSSPDALDADSILAGQAALAGRPGDSVIIATTNLAHLARFPGIHAERWDRIL
jgi:predicted nucleic acid-binding protein